MISTTITIINKLGLHARAASKFVTTANQFSSDVFLDKEGQRVNAKSIMGVMMLAASKGTELTLDVDGSDEENCSKAIIELINNKFDEEE